MNNFKDPLSLSMRISQFLPTLGSLSSLPGASTISSMPEEILLEITEGILSSVDEESSQGLVIASNISLINGRVYALSQVNRQFRRLCLPVLYKEIVIRLSEDDSSHGPTSPQELDVFRRNMIAKPHVADLVRRLFIECERKWTHSCKFDSLSLLPNLSAIEFPKKIVLDNDLLRQINLHPNLISAYWDSINRLRVDGPFQSSKELGRVRVGKAYGTNFGLPVIQHFASHGLGIKRLIIKGKASPQFLSSTFSNLANLDIHVHTRLFPEPLGWLPSFLDRHLHLRRIHLELRSCNRPALTWEALRTIPALKLFCDGVQMCSLSSSFYFASVTLTRKSDLHALDQFGPTIDHIIITEVDHTLDILRFLSPSMKALTTLNFFFRGVVQDEVPVVALFDFVSACHDCLPGLEWLILSHLDTILDCDNLPLYEGTINIDTDLRPPDDEVPWDQTSRMANLVSLLAAGMPSLVSVNTMTLRDDNNWQFCISRDHEQHIQISLVGLCHSVIFTSDSEAADDEE